jgi:DNA-directed RNA polymerase specialized sigma24 family protein
VEDRPPHDDELVERAKRGERDAYEEIVRRHQQIAFRTAWVITGSAADAEEAAQDAFVKAHRALGRFREAALLDFERRDELLAAVAALPENDRQAIACRYFLDLSEEETAAALGCRRGTVKSRLSRALGRLRERMEAGDA